MDLHICFINDHYPLPGGRSGGIGVFVQTLGRMLVQHGVKVTVVGAGYEQHSIDDDQGVQVIRIAKSKWPVGKFIQQVWRINAAIAKAHRRTPVSIIECSEVGLALIRRTKGSKKVIRMHGGHHFFARTENRKLVPWTVWQEKKAFQQADAYCAVSNYVNIGTAELLGFDPARTTVIPNGVLPDRLAALAGDTKAEKGRIVFVGTICEKKGASQLIRSFSAIKQAVPHARLYMVGPDWHFADGSSYIQYLQQFITDDIREHIIFTGPMANTEVPKWVASAEVCVYPSHMEAMPMAWLEAMALGKPLVASMTGPGPELIDHGIHGLLCDPYDPQSIADNVIRLLQDPDHAATLGKQAQERVARSFDMSILVEKNIEFYRQVVKG